MSIDTLRQELRTYYTSRSFQALGGETFKSPFWELMDTYAAAHPGLTAIQLKAAQYEMIAEHFQPVLFPHSPFFSEMGLTVAESDGIPFLSAGGWLFNRNQHLFHDQNPAEHEQYRQADGAGIHLSYFYPDIDHHCCSYSTILKNGLGGIYARTEAALKACTCPEETEFMDAARRGLLAVKKIGEKFAAAARAQLAAGGGGDPESRRFLELIATTAGEVPWRPPATFYEGLAALWFLHEVCAVVDGVRIYVLGRPDHLLGELYRRDVADGRLTPDGAYDLICRYLLYTDSKCDLTQPADESFNRQELGGTLILGGCDDTGAAVCNDLTFMVLKAHRELKLIYPKIHCRISATTDQHFLDAANREFLSGRNVISFLNDDGIIPAQVKAGKRLEDARNYVAGGCWEIMLESCEHSAGANCYFNLARILDLSVHAHPETTAKTGVVCDQIDEATMFDAVYQIVMANAVRAIRQMCGLIEKHGRAWPRVNPSPLFSACLNGCLESRKDYTAGGGRYNPHAVPLAGFAIFVDSLLAIRTLCFEGGKHDLTELLTAVRANWNGHEALRAAALAAPHFGDNSATSNELARRILNDLYAQTRDLKNERGGPFQLGLYNYRDIIDWAKVTNATPDGRRAGDYLTQGLTPSRLHRSADLTSTINSGAALELDNFPANSVLTVSLPLNGVSLSVLAQVERVYARAGIGMLQLNCVDQAQLLDAQQHPERHQDLVVRLYGYSARFVNLNTEMQNEFLSRNLYGSS